MKSIVGLNRFVDRARIIAIYLLPLVGTMLVGGCKSMNIESILTKVNEPAKTNSVPSIVTTTSLPSSWLLPTATKTLTQALTVATPTKVAMDLSISNLKLESPAAVEDMQKLIELYLTTEGVKDVVLAPEQVFSDFYNKVIPDKSNLRLRSSRELERLNIGVPVFSYNGINGDYAYIQSILMGGFTTENGAYLLLGTENSKTGDRAIVPVQVTFGNKGPWSTVGIREDHNPIRTMLYSGTLEFISAEELLIDIRGRLGRDVLTPFSIFYPADGPMAEESKIANEKFNLFDRHKSNDLFINDPLSIDKNNLLESPWVGQLFF